MSMISDFIVADRQEALAFARRFEDLLSCDDEDDEAYEAAEDRLEELEAIERLQLNGLSGLAIGLLWADLLGVPWDVNQHMPHTVAHSDPDSDGDWLLDHLQPPLLDTFLTATPERVEAALSSWVTREELHGCSLEAARQFFVDLQDLARSARAQGKDVYLYNPF